MSYDVSLVDENDECVLVNSHSEGGTHVLGGTNQATLNITYNYSWFYYKCLDSESGLRKLDGQRAGNCLCILEKAVNDLGTRRCDNYWTDTPGNAGHALNILLTWAKEHPDATFRVH